MYPEARVDGSKMKREGSEAREKVKEAMVKDTVASSFVLRTADRRLFPSWERTISSDDIPEEVKIERLQRMIELQNELSLASNRRDIGKKFEVLVEGFSKRSREQLCGRTSQNKTVVFPRGNYHVGDRVWVVIDDASSATLLGHTLE